MLNLYSSWSYGEIHDEQHHALTKALKDIDTNFVTPNFPMKSAAKHCVLFTLQVRHAGTVMVKLINSE